MPLSKFNDTSYVTKFFNPKDLSHFEAGSIRIGTLEWYGAQENLIEQGARHDPEEGCFRGSYAQGQNMITDVQVPGVYVDATSKIQMDGCVFSGKINGYIFCSSMGPYSTKLHQSLIRPGPNNYPGNCELRGYVSFRTEALIQAIFTILKRDQGHPFRGLKNPAVVAERVKYTSRIRTVAVASGQRGIGWDPVFTKPQFFAPEQEFRINLFPQYPDISSLPSGSPPFNLEGPEIADAMCFPPRVISERERDQLLAINA